MAQRHQRGWLKKEKRAQGETWVLFFRTTRKSDGKRVENKTPIGLVRDLPDASSAWAEVERLHVPSNRVDVRRGLTFGHHLRPAAVKACILSSHPDNHGRLVDDDPRRFGFHNLRHSLASFLIRIRTDPKTVQTLLRHSDVKLTLQFYTHAVSRDRMAAERAMLIAILSHAADRSGLRAD